MPYEVTDSAKNWKDWVALARKGRTHTFYGLLVNFSVSTAGLFLSEHFLTLQILFFVSSITSLGSMIDIVSHLFYH